MCGGPSSSPARSSNGNSQDALKSSKQNDCKKVTGNLTVWSQLLATIVLLSAVAFLSWSFLKLIHLASNLEPAKKLYTSPFWPTNLPGTGATIIQHVRAVIISMSKWPSKESIHLEVNWDSMLELEASVIVVGVAVLAMDLLFSNEESQGSPRLLLPTLILSLIYTVVSLQAYASGKFDPNILSSCNATEIGQGVFSQPQIVVGVFCHIFALDFALAYAMLRDFYTRVTSRRKILRFLMVGIVVATCTISLVVVPVYGILRATLFAGPAIVKPRPWGPSRNTHKRELEFLLDPIPAGDGALTGWVRKIPTPFNVPFVVAVVAIGIVRFVFFLIIYLIYITFICLPVSAVFFSLRRSWLVSRDHYVQGALYSVFEPIQGKKFPLKAVVVVSAHLRLCCIKNNDQIVFNLVIGWWLRRLLSAFVMYEFTVPFKKSFAPYCAFLMEEFGPVFPMGAGFGFGSYANVKHIMENPDLRKGGLSLAWSISEAQKHWSANNLTTHPETENDKPLVTEGRRLVRCWLKDVNARLDDVVVKKRLDNILPFANLDGTPVDQKLVEISFGSTLFHLLTGGEFTEKERRHYHKLLTNAFPFLSDFINKVWFGGLLEYLGIQDYDIMRRAFLRYMDAKSLQDTLAMAEQQRWDSWSPPEIVRFLVYKFSVAGGAAPSYLLSAIVNKIFADPNLATKYKDALRKNDKKTKRKIILEIARLERCVPLVNFSAFNFSTAGGDTFVTMFNNKIPVPDGTPLHCSVENANRDVSVFGPDAEELNFDRPDFVMGHMLTFNGNDNDIKSGDPDKPVRRCPGYDYALNIIEFLVDRFLPPDLPPIDDCTEVRLAEIAKRESFFMKFVLRVGRATYAENNKYFPHASEVLHPMDTRGNALGSRKIVAAGSRRIPENDEDVSKTEGVKESITGLVLKIAPISDDEGEWQHAGEAIKWRMKWFSSNFPPVNCDYTSDFTSMASTMSQLAFSGLSCLHTKKVDSLPRDSLIYRHANGAVYVNENTAIGDYRVRKGYQRYGAAAYFDKDCNIVGVYTCCDNKYYQRPAKLTLTLATDCEENNLEKGEYAEWRHAMWVWRVSSLAMVTVADHLVNVHMVDANTLVSASRRHLPIHHPLRAFLKMFTFRAIGINSKAAKTLIDRKAVVNRCWAFESDDLQELFRNTKCAFTKKFTDRIPTCMRNDLNYPVNQDLPKFHAIVRRFVHDFILIVYGTSKVEQLNSPRMQMNIEADSDLQSFLVELSHGLGLDKRQDLTTATDILEVLTSLVCSVTGLHELYGQISDYFAHPKICGTTLRRGKEIDSIQIYQLNCTLVSSTGLRMPRLMGNWEHLFVRHRFADDAIDALRKFQSDLRDLSIEIDEANGPNGSRQFEFNAFNPSYLESSVSV